MSAKAALLEVLAGLEPTAANRDIDEATGTDRLARPLNYSPARLYGWIGSEGYVPEGDGSLDREEFVVRVAWGVAEQAAFSSGQRSRSISDSVFAKVDAVVAWVRTHRTGTTYEALAVPRVDYEAIVSDQVRGVVLDVAGYLLITS